MDLSSILVWNVWGLNGKARRDVVREIIASTRPEIVCLQETKIQNMTSRVLLSALGSSLDQDVALAADGTRGGVLVPWNNTHVQAITHRMDEFSVSVLFQNPSGSQWWCTMVYGPQDDHRKL